MLRKVDLPKGVEGELFLHSMPARYETLNRVRSEIERLGVSRVISLAPKDEISRKSPEYYKALQTGDIGWKQTIFGITDYGVPEDREAFIQFVKEVAGYLQTGERILVHCGAGIGRTGMFAISLLMALGVNREPSRMVISLAGSEPETPEQNEFVDWVTKRLINVEKEEDKGVEEEMGDKESFELLKVLGRGGFAHTYLAKVIDKDFIEDFGTEEVVLKIPLSRKKERVLRKELELNSSLYLQMKNMGCTNIVRYLGFASFRGQIVMAMEYIRGSTLREMLGGIQKPKRLPAEVATKIAMGVLNGLAVIYKMSMIHRNINPGGIVMAGNVPKIINMSIAEILNPEDPVSNEAVGTIPYMSPEMLSSKGASYPSDIWSLGVMFYEMLTAKLPFGTFISTSIGEMVDLICKGQHTPACEVCDDIPVELSEIVDRALQKDPADRYGTATEMREALCNFLESHQANLEENTKRKEMVQIGRAIGIDLGYRNVVVADAKGVTPKVLYSNEGRPQIRSVVGLKKSRSGSTSILVGDAAENNWEMSPLDTIVSIKRLMGRGVADEEVQEIKKRVMYDIVQPSDGTKDSVRVVMGGAEYSPIDISAMILKKAKIDAEMRLGEEVTHAVITVPAYFSQVQREATRQAGLKAGLIVTKILDEPTAAAVCYGSEFPESEDPKYLLVFDLGSSTFDISVLLWAGNVFQPLNLQGDMWLGGDNFDQAIVERTVRQISKEEGIDPTSNKRFMVALTKEAQKVKIALSSGPTADLVLPGKLQDKDGDYIDVDMEVTREEFEGWVQPLVDRTIKLTEEALMNAGLSREDIHYVLMVGEFTRIPLIQRVLEEKFGKEKILRNVHPKHCVAMGAAIVATSIVERVICQAPDLEDPEMECGHVNQTGATVCERCGTPLRLTKAAGVGQQPEDGLIEDGVPELVIGGVAPFSYGTQTVGDKFNVFIKKNDPYPTETPKSQTFYTSRPKQRKISIPIYGGDCLDKASKNEKQGEIFALLPPGLPIGTPIHITLGLNAHGIFDIKGHLDEDIDLQLWIRMGENDERAIEVLQQAEVEFQAIAVSSIEEAERFKSAREQIFVKMKEKDFLGAIEDVERLLSKYNKKLP